MLSQSIDLHGRYLGYTPAAQAEAGGGGEGGGQQGLGGSGAVAMTSKDLRHSGKDDSKQVAPATEGEGMDRDSLSFAVNELAEALGIPKGFFWRLPKDDDWSFVIRLQALLEGAATHLLSTHFSKDKLEGVLSRLSFGGPASKLAFIGALGLLENDEIAYLREVARLRNTLIHDVARVSFTFADYIEALPDQERRNFLSRISILIVERGMIDGTEFERIQLTRENAKLVIWMQAMMVLGSVYIGKQRVALQAELEAFHRSISERIAATLVEVNAHQEPST